MRTRPGFASLSIMMINLPQYTFEIKYIQSGVLDMGGTGAEDIGPVEIELLFFFMLSCAGYFGVGAMDQPVNAYVATAIGNYVPDYV